MSKNHLHSDHCHHPNHKTDWFFWICFSIVTFFSLDTFIQFIPSGSWSQYSDSIFNLVTTMWWGVALGVFFVGILNLIPRASVISLFGRDNNFKGILRATLAGLLLDLCSHGILMVGAKLYERGITLGQLMAFLIASPWNSFSLTVILISLIGLKWTVLFVLFSAVVAVISGLVFEKLVDRNILSSNPNRSVNEPTVPVGIMFKELSKKLRSADSWKIVIRTGLSEGKTIVRWLLFGIIIASAIQTWISTDELQTWVGPTLSGLMMTLVFATAIEVCSEGLSPVAAEIVNRALAPGNGFAFLMTGVSTDYTELMVIRQATGSWKTAFFLPLVTLPQVILISHILNQ